MANRCGHCERGETPYLSTSGHRYHLNSEGRPDCWSCVCPYCEREIAIPQTKRLTPCELRILQLSAEGYSCSDAAMMLGVVTDTVKHHRANLIDKLGAENIANAVYIGLKTAIIV